MARDLSHLPGDLAKRADAMEKAIENEAKATRKRAGEAGKAAQLEQIEHDAGGDRVLGRVRSGKGAKVGARWKDDGKTSVSVSATGPLPLLANPMPPHDIPKKAKAKRLLIPGIGVRATVHHPGTPGKDSWNRGAEKAAPKITEVITGDMDKAVRRSFESGSSL